MAVHLDGLDTLGPSLGSSRLDDVLVEFAARLTEVVRRCDTVARVGPAEFALLIDTPSATDTDRLARRIADGIGRPLRREGQGRAVRASVGVAMSSSTDDADELILLAELAGGAAREAGGARHKPFTPNTDGV